MPAASSSDRLCPHCGQACSCCWAWPWLLLEAQLSASWLPARQTSCWYQAVKRSHQDLPAGSLHTRWHAPGLRKGCRRGPGRPVPEGGLVLPAGPWQLSACRPATAAGLQHCKAILWRRGPLGMARARSGCRKVPAAAFAPTPLSCQQQAGSRRSKRTVLPRACVPVAGTAQQQAPGPAQSWPSLGDSRAAKPSTADMPCLPAPGRSLMLLPNTSRCFRSTAPRLSCSAGKGEHALIPSHCAVPRPASHGQGPVW